MAGLYASVFQLLGNFCHQMPERSLFVFGVQLPLCIRCTAISAGGCAAGTYLLARLPMPSLRLSLAMSLPMALEVSLQSLGVFESTNALRATTGVVFGFFSLMGALMWLAAVGEKMALPVRP
ncbi:MAG: DUF2085 domain-containing protein [Acidobacteriota bacterium]